jgi:signal transduction histidine kinase
MFIFLAVRAVHVSQAVISVATAPSSYHPPTLAVAVAGAAVVESALIAVVDLRHRAHGWAVARLDALASLAGVVALAAATPEASRTTSLYWMLPYAVGAAVGLALTRIDRSALTLTGVLGAAYLAVNAHALAHGGGSMATAIVNALSIPSFYGIAALLMYFVGRFTIGFDRTRLQAIESERQLAAERERHRYQRMIHDSALQVLEAIGAGRAGDAEQMRRRARVEAQTMRSVLDGGNERATLVEALQHLARSVELDGGLRIDVTFGRDLPDLDLPAADALLAAGREALTNAAKHAGARRATARLQARDGGVELVVRDEGCGFDRATTPEGFGLSQSVRARMAEIAGRADVSSTPGLGTTVRLWSPTR